MASDSILFSDLSTSAYADACTYAQKVWARRLEMRLNYSLEHVNLGSPLEAVFYHWWFALASAGEVDPELVLHSQYPVSANKKKYRADFVFLDPDDKQPLLIVELDGHEFHEKTRAQVELRNRRDRDLQKVGFRVVHYSFTEVVSDPRGVVTEAFEAAHDTRTLRLFPSTGSSR